MCAQTYLNEIHLKYVLLLYRIRKRLEKLAMNIGKIEPKTLKYLHS